MSLHYRHDLSGNIKAIDFPSGQAKYTYNLADQIVGISAPHWQASYAYDALGNRTASHVASSAGSGNVVLLLDPSGNEVECYAYSAYGEETADDTTSPWRFASKRTDPETGFVYFGARYYYPKLGRWITQDPLDNADGPNLYAYLHNNPLTHFDLYGYLTESENGSSPAGAAESSWWDSTCNFFSDCVNSFCEGINNSYTYVAEGCNYVWENPRDVGECAMDVSLGAVNGFINPIEASCQETEEGQKSRSTKIGEYIGTAAFGVSLYCGIGEGVALLKGGYCSLRTAYTAFTAFTSGAKITNSVVKANRVAAPVIKNSSFTKRLNRFNQAASNLSPEGKNNIRILCGWAKSKGWIRQANNGGPEKWISYHNGKQRWNVIIKPEKSFREGLKEGSQIPRFDARINEEYINPFTGMRGKSEGTHIPLEATYY